MLHSWPASRQVQCLVKSIYWRGSSYTLEAFSVAQVLVRAPGAVYGAVCSG